MCIEEFANLSQNYSIEDFANIIQKWCYRPEALYEMKFENTVVTKDSFESNGNNSLLEDFERLTNCEIVYNYLKDSLLKELVKNNLRIIFYKNVHKLFENDKYGDSLFNDAKYWFEGKLLLKYLDKKQFIDAIYKYYMRLYDDYGIFDHDVLQLLNHENMTSWTDDTRLRDTVHIYLEEILENECMLEYLSK